MTTTTPTDPKPDFNHSLNSTKMKLITLAKRLDFTTEAEYFDYCVESYINGRFSQCKKLFKEMSRPDKHNLVLYIRDNYANDEIHNYFVSLF